jgi:hypothetical protein
LKVRLTRKLADRLEGIDLSKRRVGEVIDVPRPQAMLLLTHGWAILADPPESTGSKRSPRKSR